MLFSDLILAAFNHKSVGEMGSHGEMGLFYCLLSEALIHINKAYSILNPHYQNPHRYSMSSLNKHTTVYCGLISPSYPTWPYHTSEGLRSYPMWPYDNSEELPNGKWGNPD